MSAPHSYAAVLHALVDLVQAVEKQGMVGPATPAYVAALEVIREHVAPGGERSPGPSNGQSEKDARFLEWMYRVAPNTMASWWQACESEHREASSSATGEGSNG